MRFVPYSSRNVLWIARFEPAGSLKAVNQLQLRRKGKLSVAGACMPRRACDFEIWNILFNFRFFSPRHRRGAGSGKNQPLFGVDCHALKPFQAKETLQAV